MYEQIQDGPVPLVATTKSENPPEKEHFIGELAIITLATLDEGLAIPMGSNGNLAARHEKTWSSISVAHAGMDKKQTLGKGRAGPRWSQ